MAQSLENMAAEEPKLIISDFVPYIGLITNGLRLRDIDGIKKEIGCFRKVDYLKSAGVGGLLSIYNVLIFYGGLELLAEIHNMYK